MRVSATLLLLLASTVSVTVTVNAFAPTPNGHAKSKSSSTSTSSSSSQSMTPNDLNTGIEAASLSSLLIGQASAADVQGFAKNSVMALAFGGGLIPSAIKANKSMMGLLMGKKKADENASYITDSGGMGPSLPNQSFIFAREEIPLIDIIAIMGRIQNVDSVGDWKNVPSTKQAANVFWLPRQMFKDHIRNAKTFTWPVDANTGEPLGGSELERMERSRLSKKNAVIGDSALDAIFDSWAWGASVATPDKVEKTLALYKKGNAYDMGEFMGAAMRGRAVTGLGALTFIVIQVLAYSSLFIAPFLRTFFDFDIGFGMLGHCDGICNSL